MAVTSTPAQEGARMARNGPQPAVVADPEFPRGNLLAPYANFVDAAPGVYGMLSVAFSGPAARWTVDPGDGSGLITLADAPSVHTYADPGGPTGKQVAVVAKLYDPTSALRGQLSFAIPRVCHYPRQVAACTIGRAGDYPPIAAVTSDRARFAAG